MHSSSYTSSGTHAKDHWPFVKDHLVQYDQSIAWPKISIVTPTYNQGQYIEETILSIINQDYPNLEYIIIDGGSTDDSREVVAKFEKHLAYWVSERDKGQADAINKGFTKCTGNIFNWINSDDYLPQGALKVIAEAYMRGYGIIAGPVINFDSHGDSIIRNKNLALGSFLSGTSAWHQPGVWVNLDLLQFPLLDLRRRYCFDYKMMVDILKQDPSIAYLETPLMYFRLHEDSKTIATGKKNCQEYLDLLCELEKDLPDQSFLQGLRKHQAFFRQLIHCNIDVNLIKADPQQTKTGKVSAILRKMITNPVHCCNRYALGAIKNILLQKAVS